MSTDEYIVAVGSVCLLNCLMLGMSFCRVLDQQNVEATSRRLPTDCNSRCWVIPPPSNSQDRKMVKKLSQTNYHPP